MKALHLTLVALLLLGMAPSILAADPAGVDNDGPLEIRTKIVDQISRAIDLFVNIVVPESDSEPQGEPDLEGYPLVEPFGSEACPTIEPAD